MKNQESLNRLFVRTRVWLICFIFASTVAKASPPNWTVVPGQFQYNMSVTAVLNINCNELSSDTNMLGAFVNGVCRGVVKTNTTVAGRRMAFLTVYSNSSSGETVQLKFYNVRADSVCTSKVTLTFTDNAQFGTNNTPIIVRNNDAPTSISLSVTTIPESDTVKQVISSISCVDPDVADTHIYTLVSGSGSADNAKVMINGNSLVLNTALNYYVQDSLQIRIRSTDNRGCFYEQAFVIHLAHVNHPPYAIQIADSSVFDDQPLHTLVGVLSASDPDHNETFTYVLTPGTGAANNSNFSISNDSLFAETTFDSLVQHQFSIRVRVNDHALAHYERVMTILIKNFPDPPTAMALSDNRIYENLPARSFVAKMSTTDDIGHTFTYSFSNSGTNDNNSFTISNDSLLSNVMFDFETRNLYNIILTTTNSINLSYTKQFAIHIRDTLDSPTDIMISNAFVSENRPAHTFVGVFTTADVNGPGAQHTYSLVSGTGSTDNTSFAVSGDTLYSNARYDYETKNLFSIRVRTTLANNLFLDKAFAINVTEGADTITDIRITNDSIYENSSPTAFIGQLSTVSQDTSDRYTYAFDNSVTNNNSSFSLTSTGLLNAARSFDFDVKSRYVISVTSNNAGGTSFTKQFTIKIRDTLDVPTGISLSDSVVADNKPVHTFAGRLSTVDENAPATIHTYSLASGSGSTDNSSFMIAHDSLFTNAILDYGTKNVLSVRVRTTLVNAMSFERVISLLLTESADTIQNITLSNDSIYENSSATLFIGKFTTLSKDTLDHYNYTFDNSVSNDNSSFSLTTTGLLSAAKSFDFDVKSKYVISVQSLLTGGVPFVKQFTIKIRDTLDVPTGMNLSDSLVVDNKPAHTFIGKFSTVDENGTQCKHTYSLVSGAGSVDDSSFVVGNDSLYIKNTADYEAQSVFHLRIRSTLINGMNFEKVYTVYVTSGGEKPQAHNDSVSVKENSAPRYLITASASDSDSQVIFTYTLMTKNMPFAMDSVTGALSLTGPLNFHKTTRYLLTFMVKDDNHPARTDTAHIIVTVLAIQEDILPINNYVSPNGDGKNDKLVIMSIEVYTDYELTIYNTSGVVVYQSKTYDNSWDGQGLNAGVYYYTFNGLKNYKGSITLVK